MTKKIWYSVDNMLEYDTPLLLFYPERIKENIRRLTEQVKLPFLRPHVKTNKTSQVSAMMLAAGITKYKAATIAEAEMLAMINAPDVLLAYQPTLQKAKRLIRLIQTYPATQFSCLVDNADSARMLGELFSSDDLTISVFIDLNLGMNRTGIISEEAISLSKEIMQYPALKLLGLHAYDGHIREHDFQTRKAHCDQAFVPVLSLKKDLEKLTGNHTLLIAGGSPTSLIHAGYEDRECSPGTFIFWDKGYSDNLSEQPFEWAAVVACRVISIPAVGKICVDLGYKSVASENPLPRVYFLNAADAVPSAHSEEHLVLDVPDSNKYKPGDILYGIPYHICPTVALYDHAMVVENNAIVDSWKITARNRMIHI